MAEIETSGSTQVQESRPPDTTFLNPSAAVLANMFGIGVGVREGGLQYTGLSGGGGPYWQSGPYDGTAGNQPGGTLGWFGRGAALQYGGGGDDSGGGSAFGAPTAGWDQPIGSGGWSNNDLYFSKRIFGPESFANIADLLDYENLCAEGAREMMGGWADYLSGTVRPTLEEGLKTGFRTDMDPIITEAQRIYREETMPQIAQQYAGQTGAFSSDFLAANTRAGGVMGSQLGALQAQMDEAASNRRAGLLPMAGLPAELADLGLGVGGLYELLATPGGQQATLLQMLAGMQPTAAIPRGNISRGQQVQQQQSAGVGTK